MGDTRQPETIIPLRDKTGALTGLGMPGERPERFKDVKHAENRETTRCG